MRLESPQAIVTSMASIMGIDDVVPTEPPERFAPAGAQHRYFSVLALMLLAVLFLIAAPAAGWTRAVAIAMESLALVITVATSRGPEPLRRRRATVIGFALSVVVVLIALDLLPRALVALIAILVTAAVPVALVRGLLRLLRSSGVTLQSVAGSLAIYLSVGLIFAWVIGFVAAVAGTPYFANHTSGTQGEKVYFSFTVLTTTGFGDFTPAAPVGHAIAVVEMLTGQLYLVTVIGLLIGSFSASKRAE
jgi:ion channel